MDLSFFQKESLTAQEQKHLEEQRMKMQGEETEKNLPKSAFEPKMEGNGMPEPFAPSVKEGDLSLHKEKSPERAAYDERYFFENGVKYRLIDGKRMVYAVGNNPKALEGHETDRVEFGFSSAMLGSLNEKVLAQMWKGKVADRPEGYVPEKKHTYETQQEANCYGCAGAKIINHLLGEKALDQFKVRAFQPRYSSRSEFLDQGVDYDYDSSRAEVETFAGETKSRRLLRRKTGRLSVTWWRRPTSWPIWFPENGRLPWRITSGTKKEKMSS